MGGNASKEEEPRWDNISRFLQERTHMILLETGKKPDNRNAVYTIGEGAGRMILSPTNRVDLDRDCILEACKDPDQDWIVRFKSPFLQSDAWWLAPRNGQLVFCDSNSEETKWTVEGDNFGDCQLKSVGGNWSATVGFLFMASEWYDAANFPLSEGERLNYGQYKLQSTALAGLQEPERRKGIHAFPDPPDPQKAREPLRDEEQKVLDAAIRLNDYFLRMDAAKEAHTGEDLARHFKKVRKEVERASMKALQRGSFKRVEEAVLELDRRVQGMPLDPRFQAVVPLSSKDFVPPGPSEYRASVESLMMGLRMWLLE